MIQLASSFLVITVRCEHSEPVTSIVKGGVFVQSKERGVEQHGVVILHDNPLVLCLDPWLVLIG